MTSANTSRPGSSRNSSTERRVSRAHNGEPTSTSTSVCEAMAGRSSVTGPLKDVERADVGRAVQGQDHVARPQAHPKTGADGEVEARDREVAALDA